MRNVARIAGENMITRPNKFNEGTYTLNKKRFVAHRNHLRARWNMGEFWWHNTQRLNEHLVVRAYVFVWHEVVIFKSLVA